MTVIAWDGKTLAADKRATLGTFIATTTKIFRVSGGGLAGYSGNADAAEELMAWYNNGELPEKFPASQRDKTGWSSLLVVLPGGELLKFERSPNPVKFPPQNFAIGCGRDFAMAAMHLGKTSSEAVEVACALDSGCGNGIDVLTHYPQPA